MTTLPHSFKRIRLNLARSKEFPQGSARHGYEFVAPLDGKGHIDVELWRKDRNHCRVRRFWEGEDDEVGFVVHKPGGPEHGRWVFDYDQTAEDDDESGYRFGRTGDLNGERALPKHLRHAWPSLLTGPRGPERVRASPHQSGQSKGDATC
jgi:hypothetical protein